MIALALLFAPPAPPGPPRTVPIPAFEWECDLTTRDWKKFQMSGRFGEFPPESDVGMGGTEATIVTDGSGLFAGVHKVYPLSANAGAGRGWYNMIVKRPDRTYYHVHYHFYGADGLASVTVEEQQLAKSPGRFGAAAVGFCRVKGN